MQLFAMLVSSTPTLLKIGAVFYCQAVTNVKVNLIAISQMRWCLTSKRGKIGALAFTAAKIGTVRLIFLFLRLYIYAYFGY
jgi:hypothetical protein